MKKHISILFVGILLLAGACNMPQNPPIFKNLTNIKTSKVTGTNLNLTGNAIFYNPNDMGMKLKGVEIDVILEGKKVGHVSQRSKIKIPANGSFTVPLKAEIDLKQVGLVNGIFGMLSGKRMNAEFVGYIRVSKNALVMRVPIKHKELLKLNL